MIKFKTSASALLLAALAVSGCATRYKNVAVSEPQDGERVRIRVSIVKPGNYRGVRAYPNASCFSWRNPENGNVVNNTTGFESTFKNRKIGVPESDFSRIGDLISGEFYARAGQPISFTHQRTSDTSVQYSAYGQTTTDYQNACTGTLTFTPERGHDYELVFPNACGYVLNQLDIQDGRLVKQRLTAQPAPACKDPVR